MICFFLDLLKADFHLAWILFGKSLVVHFDIQRDVNSDNPGGLRDNNHL